MFLQMRTPLELLRWEIRILLAPRDWIWKLVDHCCDGSGHWLTQWFLIALWFVSTIKPKRLAKVFDANGPQ